MSKEAYIRAALAIAALERFPNLIRDALISEPEFRREYGVTVDAVLSFNNSDVAFQRSSLLAAVRLAFDAGEKAPTVNDTTGKTWCVEWLGEDDSEVNLVQDKKRLLVVHLALLSSNRNTRLRVFRRGADRVGLPQLARNEWEKLLDSRPPDDDELGAIQDDFDTTPVAVQRAVRESLSSGNVPLSALVPRSEQYYDRLIGRIEEGQTFEEFVTDSAMSHMENVVKWDVVEGYRFCLLLCAQPSISAALGALAIPADQQAKVFDELAARGDVLSRTAAIEVGLGRAQTSPDLKEPLGRLIRATVAAAPVSQVDPYRLLSALVILTYGEIANTRILASKPPFWRRLAAIAQAVMIARNVIAAGGDATGFVDWATNVRSQLFLLQCLVDLRLEPRWVAELALPDQLKNELGGRIWLAAVANSAFVTEAGWNGLLLDETEGSLRNKLNLSHSLLPGPLEGNSLPALEIPEEHIAEIQSDLSRSVITAASFSALANAALLFRIPPETADLAAAAISRVDFYLEGADEDTPLVPLLLGLATCAAVTRNHKLSDTLLVLLRRYRKSYPNELDIEGSLRVALTACGSHLDLADWCNCFGNYIIDIAFQEISREEAAQLHSHITVLCHLVPELWVTCGQAEAALRSVLDM